jgi:hypothetical protein
LRFSLSYRDVQELLAERGVSVGHSTIWRWVQRSAPELRFRLGPHLKPTNRSWRVDETYAAVKGRWCDLYRAIDSWGATIELFLSASSDTVTGGNWKHQFPPVPPQSGSPGFEIYFSPQIKHFPVPPAKLPSLSLQNRDASQ